MMFDRISASLNKWRDKRFGYDVIYNYVPEWLYPYPIPMAIDAFWLPKGFIGRNKFLLPKGNPSTARFDQTSPYYQAWIGTYFVRSLLPRKFYDPVEMVDYFSEVISRDQGYWLMMYGSKNFRTVVKKNAARIVDRRVHGHYEQTIFEGEMDTGNDDAKSNIRLPKFLYRTSTEAAKLYNDAPDFNVSIMDRDNAPSDIERVTVFGYTSITIVEPTKYIMSYASCLKECSEEIKNDMRKIVDDVSIVEVR